MELKELLKKEGWEVVQREDTHKILAYGKEYPLCHPVAIHLKLYREERNPESKYFHMKAAHDYLWPDTVWHTWTEDRFKEHCYGWKYISYAGGASTAKSFDGAKIGLLYSFGNPSRRAVIVASTTLESLQSRVWGYVINLYQSMAIKIPYIQVRGMPPKLLYNRDDMQHGLFALAQKKGEDPADTWKGRHPKEGLLIILDEATDMPPELLKVVPNLESGVEGFQLIAIGNSLSKFDTHGVLSTPKDGWNTIDPVRDRRWETTQDKGICLFFSCYESPAIHEKDPLIQQKLSKFLITKEKLEQKEKEYGKDSDSFYRFVLGFWKTASTDDTVISSEFINDFDVFERAEWSGLHPLNIVAGLDPAFSTGGDQCILRLAILGQTIDGQVVLDYRGDDLLFKIPIIAHSQKSAELQIAEQVLEILKRFNCPLRNVCIDANGQGRALGEVLRLKDGGLYPPIKIYSVRAGNKAVDSFDVVIRTYHELWFIFRDYIQNRQIRGLDRTSIIQLTSRRVERQQKTFKPQLESKASYKTRMGAIMPSLARSPDEADAASLALQSAIINFGFSPGQRRDIEKMVDFEERKLFLHREIAKQAQIEEKRDFKMPEANFSAGIESWKPPFS